jgi:hypothetical protein
VDWYEIWFDLQKSSRDVEFARNVSAYLGALREQGLIEGHRLTRRKLGFGPPELGEFRVVIETRDMAQLERCFQEVARRSGELEDLHRAVWSAVTRVRFALSRDFPDSVRGEAKKND